MSLKNWQIHLVANKTAQEVVVANHYLHRRASCTRAFGLSDPGGILRGVIMYGLPASPAPRKGVCGPEFAHLVGEITRLWIMDGTPKNSESYLIANTVKKSGYEIIITYAEHSQGHIGTIYQACNFIYTGLSSKHIDWTILGDDSRHPRHRLDELGGIQKAKEVLGEKLIPVLRPQKHRYVYFAGRRRKFLSNHLKWIPSPYPKSARKIRER